MTRVNGTSETSGRPIRKFNPGTFQSDEEVTEQFVVRTRELGTVLEILGGNVDSPSCQHVLVVGPRGRGKTMLLVRTAAEIRTDERLCRRLFPVRFMEESQEIFDMADFWLEALFHLARETETYDSDLSRELSVTHLDLSSRWREHSLEARARAAVLEAADRLDRRLVLMVENLQSLCEDVDDEFGWKLRQALQAEPQVMLLASATSRFEGLDDAEQPFFELFRTINLQPLDTDECRLLWQVVSGDDVSAREIRPLQILTGGNPRLLVIVAEFASHRSLRLLMEELVTLIDEHTEYFRGHLEVLAKTERRVYVSVIDLWKPSSAGEIAKRARMDIRIVSTMLGRLVDRGALIVEGGGRKRQYSAAERIFSIYYKLRRERDEAAVVENLITFMVVFYSGTELFDVAEGLATEAAESPVIRTGIVRALSGRPRSEDIISTAKWGIMHHISEQALAKAQSTAEKELVETIDAALRAGAYLNVIETVDRIVARRSTDCAKSSDSFIARILQSKANAHERLGDFRAVIATSEQIIRRFGDTPTPDHQPQVAEAFLNIVRMKNETGDLHGTIGMCDEVLSRYGDSDEPDLQWWVAMSLVYKGKMKNESGDLHGSIAMWEMVLEKYRDSAKSDLQWWVSVALINSGSAKKEQGDLNGAIATYEELLERFGDSDDTDLQWQVASALIDAGSVKKERGDIDGAAAAYEEVVGRYGTSDDKNLQWQVASALVDAGGVKEEQGDPQGAIAAYQEVARRYGDSDDTALQRRVAEVLMSIGKIKKELGDLQGAITVCKKVLDLYGNSDTLELQTWVAGALTFTGVLSKESNDLHGAIEFLEQAVERFGESDKFEIELWVAISLTELGQAKRELGDPTEAIAIWDEVVDRYGDSEEPALQQRVAKALFYKGRAKSKLGDPADAIVIWDEVVLRFGESDEPELRSWVVGSLVNKGMRQAEMSRGVEALSVCEDLDRRIGALPEKGKPRLEWAVQCIRALALMVQNKKEAALQAFHSAYTSFTHDDEISIREMLHTVPNLVAAGAPERELVDILSSDPVKSRALLPLIVALRERLGETVRAPAEVREVAADVREQIDERVRNWAEATSVSPESGR